MPDSSQNGHSSAPHPLIRPPVGERASRHLTASALESDQPEEALPLEGAIQPESIEEPYAFNEADLGTPGATIEVDAAPPLLDARLDEESEDEAALALGGGSGGEPPVTIYNGGDDSGSSGDPNTPRDKELGLIEHLAELRTRILYCVIAVGLAMIFTWNKCNEISEWFARPIIQALKGHGTPIVTSPAGFFTIYLQISMISALLLTMPFILLQVWRFIEPALTNNERKYTIVLVPFSSILFFLGAYMGYLMSPMFFKFFLAFQFKGVAANWDYFESIILLAKTLLIFGIAFQVPVFTIFLNKSGIVSRNLLIQYWRHAIVVIFTLIAFVVPTWDPITMTACAVPPCLLYLLSIWLVKWL